MKASALTFMLWGIVVLLGLHAIVALLMAKYDGYVFDGEGNKFIKP